MKKILQAALAKFGYRLSRVANTPKDGLTYFFEAIQRAGFTPRHIVDVGANHGNWTRSATRFFPEAQYTLIEPQDHLKVYIQDLLDRGHKLRWINAAVGDKPGILPFTIATHDNSSTFTLSESEARRSGAEQVPVQVTTLNDLIASGCALVSDMVKIDAEGFDLSVGGSLEADWPNRCLPCRSNGLRPVRKPGPGRDAIHGTRRVPAH